MLASFVGASVFAWVFLVACETHNKYCIKRKVDDGVRVVRRFESLVLKIPPLCQIEVYLRHSDNDSVF